LVVNLASLALCARQNFFFVAAQLLAQSRNRRCTHLRIAFRDLSANANALLAGPDACQDAANGQATVDKPMYIHRNECAERLTFASPENLYKIRASQKQGLFKASGNA